MIGHIFLCRIDGLCILVLIVCLSSLVCALIFKVCVCMVTPELSDIPATWISDHRATDVSSITLQLRGSYI
jgi:hypothetical protein